MQEVNTIKKHVPSNIHSKSLITENDDSGHSISTVTDFVLNAVKKIRKRNSVKIVCKFTSLVEFSKCYIFSSEMYVGITDIFVIQEFLLENKI